jgi:tRNA(fMet)-specific endonuclease VapC
MLAKSEEAVAKGESVAITIVTKVQILPGRMAALLKANSHEQFLNAQRRLIDDEEVCQRSHIVLLDQPALRVFDELVEIKGLKKIGRADLLIASIARAHKATLVTRNQKHFKLVPQLKLANWVD